MFPENRFMEVLIIGALALIVIGPKDLPMLMRRVGQFVGKMRGMAAEFRASFDELARQSELDELRREVEALRTGAGATGEDDAHTSGVFDDIRGNLNLTMTPAMTPLPQPEIVSAPQSVTAEPAPQAEPKAAPKPRARAASKPKAAPAATAKPAKTAKSAPAKAAARKSSTRATGPAS